MIWSQRDSFSADHSLTTAMCSGPAFPKGLDSSPESPGPDLSRYSRAWIDDDSRFSDKHYPENASNSLPR